MTTTDQSESIGQREPGRPPALECREVSFSYDGVPVLENINLFVEEGEFAAVLGPNGGGKTTLLRLVLGLEQVAEGHVTLFGQRPAHAHSQHVVGYVPQRIESTEQFSPTTVEEVVGQGQYRGFNPVAILRRSASDRVMEALEAVGIVDLRGRRMSSLSIGQQQRALVARALVRDARMLVLDEPVAGVDAAGQEQFFSLLRRLNREQGMTVLLVSHDVGTVMREATTVACINRTMVFHGPPRRLTQEELSSLYGLDMDILMHDALHEHR